MTGYLCALITGIFQRRLQTRDWDDKDGNKRTTTEIVANTMTMLGQAGGGTDQGYSNNTPSGSSEPSNSSNNNTGGDEFEDDDIPF